VKKCTEKQEKKVDRTHLINWFYKKIINTQKVVLEIPFHENKTFCYAHVSKYCPVDYFLNLPQKFLSSYHFGGFEWILNDGDIRSGCFLCYFDRDFWFPSLALI